MPDDRRTRSTRTHTSSTGGSSHGHKRRGRQNPRGPPSGLPREYINAHPNSQNENGSATSQVGLAGNPYASPDAGDTGVVDTQDGPGMTASSASTADYESSGMIHSDDTFGSSAYNNPFYSAVPPEEDNTPVAVTYQRHPESYYSYPPDNPMASYSTSEQPPLYSTALTSGSPLQYYSSSGYQAFDSDNNIVSHAAAQDDYTSSGAAGAVPMTSPPPSFGTWNNGNGGGAPIGQEPAPDGHYDRGRAGSGDSGTSTQVVRGSVT